MVPRVTVQTFGKRPNDVPWWDRRSDDVVLLPPLLRTARLVYRSGHFLRSENVLFFFGDFFFTLSVSTLNLYYSVHFHVAEGSFRPFRAFFFSVDPSVLQLMPRLYSTGLINGT